MTPGCRTSAISNSPSPGTRSRATLMIKPFKFPLTQAALVLALLVTASLPAGILSTGALAPTAASQGAGGAHGAFGNDAGDYLLNPGGLSMQDYGLDLQEGSLFAGSAWLMGVNCSFPLPQDLVGALGSHRLWTD